MIDLSNTDYVHIQNNNTWHSVSKILQNDDTVLWEKKPFVDPAYADEYFTIQFAIPNDTTKLRVMENTLYSYDKVTWYDAGKSGSKENCVWISNLQSGTVYLKRTGSNWYYYSSDWLASNVEPVFDITYKGSQYTYSLNYKVSGNLLSLVCGDDFRNQTSGSYSFPRLFGWSKKVVPAVGHLPYCYNADNLVLPSFISSFPYMFTYNAAIQTSPLIYYPVSFNYCSSLKRINTCFTELGSKLSWLTDVSTNGVLYQPIEKTYDDSLLNLPSTWSIVQY